MEDILLGQSKYILQVRAGVLPKEYDFEAHKELVPMQAGDVPVTYADTSALERYFVFKPQTSLREGLRKFAEWYSGYYQPSANIASWGRKISSQANEGNLERMAGIIVFCG